VTWRTGIFFAAAAAFALGGCASSPALPEEAGGAAPAEAAYPDWRGDARRVASQAAHAASGAAGATWQAARKTGDALGTAAHGVRSGFERPADDADYGSYPSEYAGAVKAHFRRVLRVPEGSSFRFGKPERGYMNEGLLQGGGVVWRGYLVDVEVTKRAALFGGEVRAQLYVVRLRDGEVIDVHRGAEHKFLGRVLAARSED
jgi:hypothetical protein